MKYLCKIGRHNFGKEIIYVAKDKVSSKKYCTPNSYFEAKQCGWCETVIMTKIKRPGVS